MTQIAIVYHSGYGHTKVIAESVVKGVQKVAGAKTLLISVDQIDKHWTDLENSNAIIFGSPTYMGTVSGPFKMFMDQSSAAWMGRKWLNKLAAGFTVSGSPSGDKLATLQALSVFSAQHGMLWVGQSELPGQYSGKTGAEQINRLGSFLGVMAQAGQESPEVSPPPEDHLTASGLGQRVAELALRFK